MTANPMGSVLNFVSMLPCPIPEAKCEPSPRVLINIGHFWQYPMLEIIGK